MQYLEITRKNLGLWMLYGGNNPDANDYINLYMHNGELYFTQVREFSFSWRQYKNNGVYVLIGKLKLYKEIWEPKFVRNAMAYIYSDCGTQNIAGYPVSAKKLKIHEIIDHAKIIEKLTIPAWKEISEETEAGIWAIDIIIDLLGKDYQNNVSRHRKRTIEDFLKEDRDYGNEMQRRCYLNPFQFETEYPEIVEKSREKKWWQFNK